MDSDIIMSATAGAQVGAGVLSPEYWRAFAPTGERDYILERVGAAVEKPHLAIKSVAGTELRAQFEGRLGVAGVIHKGEVAIAFPFVKGEQSLEIDVKEVVSAPGGTEGWVVGECEGVRLSFYDPLRSTGRSHYEGGDRRRFVINALALSLRRVKPLPSTVDPDEDLILATLSGLRMYIPGKGGSYDSGIFQSPIDGSCESTPYAGREFRRLPISLGERDEQRITIDLFVAPEIVESLGAPLGSGDELAGVLWLQGYLPDDIN